MPPDWEFWGWSWGNLTVLDGSIIPADADLMIVSLIVPYEYFDVDENYIWDHRWGLCIQDWNDTDADGEIDINEVYHINYGYNTGTSNEVRIGFPNQKFKYTPLIFIYQIENEDVDPISAPFMINIKFYKRVEWDWVEMPNNITVNASSNETFSVKINVPPEAAQGVYEGQILINMTSESTRMLTVPLSVNVPAVIPPSELTYDLKKAPSAELYDSYIFNGYFDWGGSYESGDWKTWFIDIEDPNVIAAFISCNWTNRMTDADLYIINPTGILTAATINSPMQTGTYPLWIDRYVTNRSVASYTYNIVGSPVPGIYTVLLHNTLFNGTAYPERLTGGVELVKLTPKVSVTVPIKPGGSEALTFTLTTGRQLNNVTILLNPYTQFSANITPSIIEEIPAMGSSSFNVSIPVPKDSPAGIYPIQIGVFIPELLESTGMPASTLLNVVVDDAPPAVNIISPVKEEIQSGTINIKVYAKDELDSVSSVKYSIDDASYVGMVLDEATGLWTATLNTEDLQDGLHSIKVNATDRAGNSRMEELTFIVDNTKPQAQVAAQDYMKGSSDITVTGEDTNFDRMELYIDGILISEWSTPATKTFKLNTARYKDGMHLLKLIVYDKAGHVTVSETATTIDNTAPTAEIRSPSDNSFLRGVVPIIVRGSDVNLRSMDLYVAGSLVKTWTVGGTQQYSLDTTTLKDGDSSIRLVVKDMAGNTVVSSVKVIIDNTAPLVNIEAPSDGETLKGDVNIIFTASDTNLEKVLLYIDGASIPMAISEEYTYLWDTSKVGDGSHEIKVEAYDIAGNKAETSISVNTINIKLLQEETFESTRNMYLAIGIPIGFIVGALIAWALARRRT